MCEKSFEKHKLLLGEDHPETLESMHLLANVCSAPGKYKTMYLLAELYCEKGEFTKSIILGSKLSRVAPFRAVQILWKGCARAVQILWKGCTIRNVQILWTGCTRAVQILWKRCTIRNVMIMAYAFLPIYLCKVKNKVKNGPLQIK